MLTLSAQEQARHVAARMRERFQELRDFLEATELDSVAALWKEEREKSAAVGLLQATAEVDIASLAGDIAALQEQMALDGVPLLRVGFQDTRLKISLPYLASTMERLLPIHSCSILINIHSKTTLNNS